MRKILLWVAVILWMGLIFKLSSQPAVQSGKLSGKVTNINIKAIEKVKPDTKVNKIEFDHIIRKNAHFFIYLALGILIMNALMISGLTGYKSIIITLIICILFAASDEIHQIFVPGRGAQITDVVIDSAGVASGILINLCINLSSVLKRG